MANVARLGIFGGTFDPVHIGHLVAAVNVRQVCGLDRVLLVVADQPWQKVGTRPITPAATRLACVQAAVTQVEGLEASALEIDRGGPSYTVDTLRVLQDAGPGDELFLVVGADTASKLHTWEQPEAVAALARLVVVNRPGSAVPRLDPMWQVQNVEIPALDVSSTDLRRRLAEGRPVDFLIPDMAVRFIRANGLYAGGLEVDVFGRQNL